MRSAACAWALLLVVLSAHASSAEPSLLLQRARALGAVPLYAEAHDAYRELWRVLEASPPLERDKLWSVEQEALLWLGVTARRLGRNTEALEWLQVHCTPTHKCHAALC